MKTSRLFTIDVEIAERLKNINASKIVNDLLREFFEVKGVKNTLLEQKQAILEHMGKKKGRFLKTLRLLLSSIRSGLIILVDDGLKLVKKCLRIKKLENTPGAEKFYGQKP